MGKGYVYAMTNRAMPGLIKIGYSGHSGTERRKQLSNTSVPYPFELLFELLVEDPFKVEQIVHSNLHEYCENKEYFRINETAAMMAIIDVWLNRTGFDANYLDEWLHQNKTFPVVHKPTAEEKAASIDLAIEAINRIRKIMGSERDGKNTND